MSHSGALQAVKRVIARVCWILLVAMCSSAASIAADPPKKIIFLAGTKSHGPGHHEYERGLRLMARCLEQSANAPRVQCEVYTDGWPTDEHAFDGAATIVAFCDGSDHDIQAHPLLRPERLAKLDELMRQGIGLVALHYTVFAPRDVAGQRFLEWLGGYFDYESGSGQPPWFSKIATHKLMVQPATPEHPIARGLAPFELNEEFYYNIRFQEPDRRRTPVLNAPIPGEAATQTVAWAVERADGGRGFGFTGGHFHSNWGVEPFRRMVLNAILWTAQVDVPEGGVASEVSPGDLAMDDTPPVATPADLPIRAVILTGHQHPAHDWRATTRALEDVMRADPRFQVATIVDPERLTAEALADYDVLVLNYCNWERPTLGDAARQALVQYVERGGGLAVVHFANGAFLDWPDYRRLVRRVWIEGASGHDAHGPFHVDIYATDHPITRGLAGFDTADELYFKQQGDAAIEPLVTARSKVTGHDEPMAFAYDVEKGRVFQTVLGHDAYAIRNPGTADLIRRGITWAARREILLIDDRPASVLVPGHAGQALDARLARMAAAPQPIYEQPPLSVECWAKLRSKSSYNILVAHAPKESNTHWELYTRHGTGGLSAYVPGCEPAVIETEHDVCDDTWHHLAMVFERERLRLYVDRRLVSDVVLKITGGQRIIGPLWFGAYPPGGLGCDGLLDEARISVGAIDFTGSVQPAKVEQSTIGLWRFDAVEDRRFHDESPTANPAVVDSDELDRSTYRPAADDLKTVLLDRSPDESFLSVRGDGGGRLFVGGREALFVYEPAPSGGYLPRRELYRFPPHSWVTDIEIRGDDLYVMTTTAIYRMPGARVHRQGLSIEKLIWGWPVDLHVTLHGLAWGPEGDLYFAAGDPLLNYGDFANRPDHWGHWMVYSQPAGTATPYTGQGGVFRCRPDGTNFRVVARGTRASDGLAFDEAWNLFTNDNDHESIPARYVPARILHVTPRADFGWPRGWMPDITPERHDLLPLVYGGMGRGVPVAMAYYHEPFLPARLRGTLLVPRWEQRAVTAYAPAASGASFTADELRVIEGQDRARPVGVVSARGGRIVAAISYMAQNEGSPVYPSDLVMITRADDELPYGFTPSDVTADGEAALYDALSDVSRGRRQAAHQEILRRGGETLATSLSRLSAAGDDDPPLASLMWLAGAVGGDHARELLLAREGSARLDVRWQAVRALAEYVALGVPREFFIQRLSDADPRVQLAAVAALFDRPGPVPRQLFEGPACSSDPRVRQAAALLLAEQATAIELIEAMRDSNPAMRLAGVLAGGFRLTMPAATAPVPTELPLNYYSQNANFAIDYADGRVDLKSLARVGSFTVAERWRAVTPTDDERRVFAALQEVVRDDDDVARRQAMHFLNLLDDPETRQLLVEGRVSSIMSRLAERPSIVLREAWVCGPIDMKPVNNAPMPESGPVDLRAQYAGPAGSAGWQRVAGEQAIELAARQAADAATYVYFRIEGRQPGAAFLETVDEVRGRIWHNGLEVGRDDRATAIVDLQPGANDILIKLESPAPASLTLAVRAEDDIAVSLPEIPATGSLADRLRGAAQAGGGDAIAAELLAVDWPAAVKQGDWSRGRTLFGADGLGCIKCHAVGAAARSGGAPSLDGVGRRLSIEQLVEAVLAPSRQIAPVFRATTIETSQGQVLSGLIVAETADELELLLPDATRRKLGKSDVEARELTDVSPMPSGLIKTPQELADLLAFLTSDNPVPP